MRIIYSKKRASHNECSQVKAAVKVNSEQLLFNWQLGRDLVIRKAEEKWGTGIISKLAAYVVLGINEDGMKEVLSIEVI